MNHQVIKRTRLALGLTMLAVAVGAFASAGSAAAATQHWAGASQVPYGGSQSFSGVAEGRASIDWELGGGAAEFECNTQSVSGTVSNPAGGGSGTIESGSFQLGGCRMVGHVASCAVEAETITFPPFGKAVAEAGKDQIRNKGYKSESTTLKIVTQPGHSCAWQGSYPIEGVISATALAGNPGKYLFEGAEFRIGEYSADLHGAFALSTASKEALVLSSGASPGAPHWYLGSAKWTAFATGGPIAYATSGAMSFDLESEVAGALLDVSCSGSSNGIAGSLENPGGGGAGTTSATLTLNECTLPAKSETCSVQPMHSAKLAGVATEVGGGPAVEFSIPAGGKSVVFKIVPKTGKSCAWIGEYWLEGSLIATSMGDGQFELSAGEITVNELFPATVDGSFALASGAGQSLRLQP